MIMQQSSHPALSYADQAAASTTDALLLVGRILLGWIFVRSGFPKLFDIPGVATSFPGRGIPAFMAYISVPFEFFGGGALILGLATRYVVIGFVIFILVATFFISFTRWPIVTSPQWVGLGNYRAIIHSHLFWQVFWNTLYFVRRERYRKGGWAHPRCEARLASAIATDSGLPEPARREISLPTTSCTPSPEARQQRSSLVGPEPAPE